MAEVETNIMRYLSSNNIDYQLLEHVKSAFTSREAAELRNVKLSKFVKSLILVENDREILVEVLSATKRVGPKRLKSVENINILGSADESDIEGRPGYEVGAIPPLSLKIHLHICGCGCIIK